MSALVTASTFSKDPRAWGFEDGLCVVKAKGAYLTLSDGNSYIDFVSGLGTNLIGYDVLGSPKQSISPSLPHYLEYSVADKLADMLSQHVPGWSSVPLGVRWCKTGTDATTMAVRLARAITGIQPIWSFGYHGWADWSIGLTKPALGITDQIGSALQFNDLEDLRRPGHYYLSAAAIIEQPASDLPSEFYPTLRKLCDDRGALLIMDEVVTGLRYGMGGASERYGVCPDLICLGKSLGNGAPIGALVGPKEYMDWFSKDSPVFCSSTTWGESHGLRAANTVLDFWDAAKVEYIWDVGDLLMSGLREMGWDVFGHGARSVMRFEDEYERAWFIHGMRERGVLMNRPNFPCFSHTEKDVSQVVDAARDLRADESTLDRVRSGELSLPTVLFKDR